MRLLPGVRLGPYEIVAPLGAGGMGEVYRARDPRLNREVAIKVLPADRLTDPNRRRRFVQEAQAASALNHPHIVTIYEIESADGVEFIAMEYVRGKSLDALIPRHGLRLSEVLRIAIPVADAVAAAHARGIVHRDLKPANVMVGDEGAVKVLDFGLAKLVDGEVAPGDRTLTVATNAGLSAPGTVAGTVPYMSPEQATGGKVDARSDIFSFGAMLYEMVTGVRAFAGASTADALDAVVRAQPKPPAEIRPNIPADLSKAILRCLRKDPERRFQHIDDVKVALQDIKEDSASGSATTLPARRHRGVWGAAALAGAVSVVAAIMWLWPNPEVPPPRVVSLTASSGAEHWPSFSPDGNQIVFASSGEKDDNWDIYLKFVGSSDVRRLTTDAQPEGYPRWSPDGQHIAFLRCQPDPPFGCQLRLMSAVGGADSKVSELRVANGQIDWSPDGRFLVAGINAPVARQQAAGLYLLPTAGGTARRLTMPRDSTDRAPAFSPDGHRLAYASCTSSGWDACDVYLLDLDDTFAPTGPARRLTSQAHPILALAWSRNGRSILYDSEAAPLLYYLWRVDADGPHSPVRIEVAGARALMPATTGASDRLAFSRLLRDLDVYEMEWGKPPQPIAQSSFYDFIPQFSPDGRQMVFCSERSGESVELWIASADGSGARQVTRGMGRAQCAGRWSPNGEQIALDSLGDDGKFHVWVIDPDGGTRRQVTRDSGSQRAPTWSQDGRWIYYWRQLPDHSDIWRTRLADGVKEQVTHTDKTEFGLESPDGNHYVYQLASGALVEKPLAGGNERQVVKCALGMAFAVRAQGIYFAGCEPGPDVPVYLLDPATGKQQVIGKLEKVARESPFCGLAVSPDGTRVLYTRVVNDGADLMLIENFR